MNSVMYRSGYALAALLMSMILTRSWSRRRTGLSVAQALNLALALTIAFLVGARAWFLIVDAIASAPYHRGFAFYRAHPLEPFMMWHGGMSFHGGLLAAVVAGLLLVRCMPGVNAGRVADDAVLQAPLCDALGRIATFLSGGETGRVDPAGFGYALPGEVVARWPWHLFEAMGMLLAVLPLLIVARRARLKPYGVFAVFLVAYGALRLLVDGFRGDTTLLGWTVPQIVSLIAIGLGIVLLLRATSRRRPA